MLHYENQTQKNCFEAKYGDYMIIRKARMEDRLGIERLLKEVNNLHQKLRPDIFIENAIKYNEEKFNALI